MKKETINGNKRIDPSHKGREDVKETQVTSNKFAKIVCSILVSTTLTLTIACGGNGESAEAPTQEPTRVTEATATATSPAPTATATQPAPTATSPAPTATTPPVTVEITILPGDKLAIKHLGIEAPLAVYLVDAQGRMPNAEHGEVAIYDFSAPSKEFNKKYGGIPGKEGNTVFYGKHSIPNTPSTFFELYSVQQGVNKIQAGDIIDVTYQGVVYSYSVTSVNDVSGTSTEWDNILSATEEETITILTDKPNNTRLVVKAERIQ